MGLKSKNFFFLLLVIAGIFFFWQTSKSYTTYPINLHFTVPDNGNNGGGGGGGGGGSNPPAIKDVVSSVSFTTATITWLVLDNTGVASVSFVYGTTQNYGSNGNVAGAYGVELSGLASTTLYHFKIIATDTSNETTEYVGTFTTTEDPSGPPPLDNIPPIISNIQIVEGITTAGITWNTNELADTQLNYGLTDVYGSNYFSPNLVLNHNAQLVNLLPNRTYHFKIIATDAVGNSASTLDWSFITFRDVVSPPNVSNFILTTTSNSIVLSWTNPSLVATPDFYEVLVVRKIGGSSNNDKDGDLIYRGTQEDFTDVTVVPNTNYFYTIFSFDTSGNRSPGIFRNGSILPPPPPPPVEICNNNIDDNNNGRIDCADVACAAFPACQLNNPPTSTPEVCNNRVDDDGNGRIDCADAACAGFAACINNNPAAVACNNGVDDDQDGKVDFPADEGCERASDADEYNAPEPTVPDFIKINLNNLLFLAGNRQIRLWPVQGIVTGLSAANLTIGIPESVLENTPKSMVLKLGDTDQHRFVYNASNKTYYTDVSFGRIGMTQAYIEIDYGVDQFDSVALKLQSLPWGQITDKDSTGISGAVVALLKNNGGAVPMGEFGQLNPITSDVNGSFGWLVPNGNYRITVSKEGYYERSLNVNGVNNNVINQSLQLIQLPKKLEIDPEATVGENIKNVAGALADQSKALSTVAVQKIQDKITDPGVKQVTEQVVAPAAITAVVAGAAPLVSWASVLPFLRLLFLQPLMLLGWRKREKWGVVYNSLNKMPVDLAMVRLINAETGRVVQSKVTDSKGRYMFLVGPGTYRLQAQKANFLFPSNFLAGHETDGKKVDIYHGEIIEVKHSTGITATIPLDPVGAQKKPSRLLWEKFGRRMQKFLGVLGIAITAISLYISPKWYIGVLLGVHVGLYFIVRKLATVPKIRSWGLVSDHQTKAPISRVVARLFNSQFNKLVDMQVTDSDGKYHFIAGDAKYYVTYEHKDYHPQKTDIIDLEGKEAEVITLDVSLKKQ